MHLRFLDMRDRPLLTLSNVNKGMEQVTVGRPGTVKERELDTIRPTAQDLWDRHGAAVCRFAAMVARSDQEAEDIAQEALVRAIRALPRFQSTGGGIEAWLWRIVQNTALDFGRAARRRQMLLGRLLQLADRKAQPWPDVDRQIRSWELIGAIRALPTHQRTLVALRFGADMDYAAIARLVGLSPLAARAATRRALLALRRELERSGSL